MNNFRPVIRRHLVIEYLFVIGIAAALVHITVFFLDNGYLRQPFFYEPSGTWMDWYSLSVFGRQEGAYDINGTIYPPISFVIMGLFGFDSCYHSNFSEEVRYCDWLGMVFICGTYLIAVTLTFFHFYKFDRTTFFPRAFAIAFGFPMLYGFERGNTVVVAYIFYLLAFGPLMKSARLKWLCAAIVVNFKIYMIAAILTPLVRRRWRAVEGMLIATLLVYLITWRILGEGSPAQVIRNLTIYSGGFGAQRLLDLWFSSSLVPLRTLMVSEFPLFTAFSLQQVELLWLFSVSLTYFSQGLMVAALAVTWVRPEVVPTYRVIFFGALIALSTKEAGGYTQIFLLMSIFMERWRGYLRPAAILLAYISCIPDDWIINVGLPPLVRDSFLGDREVIVQYGIGPLSLARPILMLIIGILLAWLTIKDVWVDVRNQGWSNRWRFRRDAALFPGVLAPRPEARG